MDWALTPREQDEYGLKRQELLHTANESGYNVAAEMLGESSEAGRSKIRQALGGFLRDSEEVTMWDNLMKKKMSAMTTDIIKETIKGQRKQFPLNNLTLMTSSGAKGSLVNVSQICCLLGLFTRIIFAAF